MAMSNNQIWYIICHKFAQLRNKGFPLRGSLGRGGLVSGDGGCLNDLRISQPRYFHLESQFMWENNENLYTLWLFNIAMV